MNLNFHTKHRDFEICSGCTACIALYMTNGRKKVNELCFKMQTHISIRISRLGALYRNVEWSFMSRVNTFLHSRQSVEPKARPLPHKSLALVELMPVLCIHSFMPYALCQQNCICFCYSGYYYIAARCTHTHTRQALV